MSLLRLVPVEVVGIGRQLGLWGEDNGGQERVERAVDRVLGLLGPTAVVTAVLAGGRDVAGRVRAVPWGEPRVTGPGRPAALAGPAAGAVPGDGLAGAGPGRAHWRRRVVRSRCPDGSSPRPLPPGSLSPVGRSSMSSGGPGPWPADTRWWDPGSHRRQARVQVVTADERAHLLVLESGQWRLEATYD